MSRSCARAVGLEDQRPRAAPSRSACFSWPLRPRPPRSISAESPACRSSRDQRDRARRAAPGRRSRRRRRVPARGSSSSSASRIRSIPAAQPTAGVGRPAELLDQAVVAAAAADLRLRAERVADEREDRPRVVVEAADQGRVELVVDPGRVEQRPDLGEVLGVLARRGASSDRRRARPSPPCVPSSSESKARSGLMSIRSRTSSERSPSWRAQVGLQLLQVGARARRASRGCRAAAPPPARRAPRAGRRAA